MKGPINELITNLFENVVKSFANFPLFNELSPVFTAFQAPCTAHNQHTSGF